MSDISNSQITKQAAAKSAKEVDYTRESWIELLCAWSCAVGTVVFAFGTLYFFHASGDLRFGSFQRGLATVIAVTCLVGALTAPVVGCKTYVKYKQLLARALRQDEEAERQEKLEAAMAPQHPTVPPPPPTPRPNL